MMGLGEPVHAAHGELVALPRVPAVDRDLHRDRRRAGRRREPPNGFARERGEGGVETFGAGRLRPGPHQIDLTR